MDRIYMYEEILFRVVCPTLFILILVIWIVLVMYWLDKELNDKDDSDFYF